MKDSVTIPNIFIGDGIKKEIIIMAILTLKMTPTPCLLGSKIEIILYVCCFHLTPSMVVILPIYSLHLAIMPF
jgi:hypothetical protein